MRLTFAMLTFALIFGCAESHTKSDSKVQKEKLYTAEILGRPAYSAADLAGHYYEGDNKGFNLDLYLDETGAFGATLCGCAGPVSKSTGTWSIKNNSVVFSVSESNTIPELTVASVVDYHGATTLLREQNQEYMGEHSDLFTLYLLPQTRK